MGGRAWSDCHQAAQLLPGGHGSGAPRRRRQTRHHAWLSHLGPPQPGCPVLRRRVARAHTIVDLAARPVSGPADSLDRVSVRWRQRRCRGGGGRHRVPGGSAGGLRARAGRSLAEDAPRHPALQRALGDLAPRVPCTRWRRGRVTRRTKVLQVVLDLEAGGLERLVADLVRGIDRSRFDVELLALSHVGRYGEGLEAVAPVHTCRSFPLVSLLWPRKVAGLIRRIAPDVVHSHSGVWYKSSKAARLAGVPRVIHTDHGRRHVPDYRRDRFFDTLAARRTDVVVAVSDPLAKHMANGLVDPAKVQVIRNGVDTKAFAPRPDDGALRASWGIAPGRPVIATVGRFDPIKRYDVMIE